MSEFEEKFGKNFFVIDSFNLNEVKQNFFGFALQNNTIIQEKDIDYNNELSGIGSYILIKVDSNEITISQDYMGSYGLYLYENEDYFAISNSFIKLVNHLKNNVLLSFDKKYSDAYLFAPLSTIAYDKTPINEITLLPRNIKVIISRKTGALKYAEFDFEEGTILLDSEEGMALLDEWYYRWVETLRFLKTKTNFIEMDLSGGFDSRVVAAIWLSANIDLSKVTINSYTFKEQDFEIASKIANYFKFNLNNNNPKPIKVLFNEMNTVLNISFYLKLGFHKEMYFKYLRYDEPLYSFSGSGGEGVRGYYNKTPQEYCEKIINEIKIYSEEVLDSTRDILNYSLEKLRKKFNLFDESSYELAERMFMENNNRHHFGKDLVENYFSNNIKIAPLMDWNLQKLVLKTDECDDRDLLIALILQRYCPDLLKFEIEGGRGFDKETINHAIILNNKYPFIKKNHEFISGPDFTNESNQVIGKGVSHIELNNFLKNVFASRFFEMEFKKYYSSDIYNTMLMYGENKNNRFPLKHIYAAILAMKMIQDTKYKFIENTDDSFNWLNSFLKGDPVDKMPNNVSRLLLNFVTARIDLKNHGSEDNSIKIIENSDSQSKIHYPNWFKSENGEGLIIHSNKLSLDLKFKCIHDGLLKMYLRGPDIRDKNRNRFPVYIDYTICMVNDELIFDDNILVWHDQPYLFEKEVKNSEIIHIHLEWLPFNNSCTYNK